MPIVRRFASSGALHHLSSPPLLTSQEVFAIEPADFLDSVAHFGAGRLVMKGGGLSFCSSCCLLAYEKEGELWLSSDQGLALSSSWIQSVTLMETPGEPIRFEVEMLDSGRSLSFYPGDDSRTLRGIEGLKQRTKGQAIHSHPKEDQAGSSKASWLNQDLGGEPNAWDHKIVLAGQPGRYRLHLELKSSGTEITHNFEVAYFDAEEDIFRLAAAGGETALYLSIDQFETTKRKESISLVSSHTTLPRETRTFEEWINPALMR